MKKLTPRFAVLAAATLIAVSANAQTTEQNVNVTIRPSQTVEQRVADEIKAKELKKAAEEKLAAEEVARIAETSPQALLRRARVVYISSSTDFFEAVQLQNALRKHQEFDTWQMAIVDRKPDAADIYISASYVTGIDSAANKKFLAAMSKKFGADLKTPNDLSVPEYEGVYAYKAAVEKAGGTDPQKVLAALSEVSVDGPRGNIKMNKQRHAPLTMYLGQVQADGSVKVIQSFPNVDPGAQCPPKS